MQSELATIIYVSSATRRFDDAELVDLLNRARRRNVQDGITGMLLYHDGSFAQALEGPDAAVRKLFRDIRDDRRHRDIVSHGPWPTGEREFSSWSMGFAPSSARSHEAAEFFRRFLNQANATESGPNMSVAWALLAFVLRQNVSETIDGR